MAGTVNVTKNIFILPLIYTTTESPVLPNHAAPNPRNSQGVTYYSYTHDEIVRVVIYHVGIILHNYLALWSNSPVRF